MLGNTAAEEAFVPLVAALHDRSRDVRAAAARSLGRLGDPRAIDPLLDAFASGEVPEGVIAQALLEIGSDAGRARAAPRRQRRRWQRGLAETLWRHRRVIGNPRYGVLGLVAMPYFLLFELAGPVLAVGGLPVIVAGTLTGVLSTTFLAAFLAVSLLFGTLLSVAALALEELSFRRHERHLDVLRMLGLALEENLCTGRSTTSGAYSA